MTEAIFKRLQAQLQEEKNKTLKLKNLLRKLKSSEMWKVSKAPGGQDQYVGKPPAIREIDSVLAEIEWIESEFKKTLENL